MCAPLIHYLDHGHATLGMFAIKHQHEMLQLIYQYHGIIMGCPLKDDLANITVYLLNF